MTDILDSLLKRIDDDQLRDAITAHVAKLKDGRKFGLVFEDHLPEAIRLPNAKVRRGSRVARRDGDLETLWTVAHVRDGAAIVVDDDGNEHPELVSDLDVVREWGQPVYPGLKPVASVAGPGADPDAPHHVVINGENLHALEALRYTHAESVDLIYIDPPYNTGNDSWIYNDRYVSGEDEYRHSKWLSFMHRRLELARALLKPTGVIIVAIGDDEHHRLRMLMDQVFGARNFIGDVTWQGGKKSDSRYLSRGADYMIIYARSEAALNDRSTRWREPKVGVDEILAAGEDAWQGALFDAYCEFFTDAREHFEATHNPAYGEDSEAIRTQWVETSIPLREHKVSEFQIRQRASEIATARLKAWWRSLPKEHPAQASKHYNHVCGYTGKVFFPADISWPGGGGPTYPVIHPATGKAVVAPSGGWRFPNPERMQQEIEAGRIHFGPDHTRGINRKSYLEDVSTQVVDSVFYRDRRAANRHLQSVLGDKRFPFPKDHEVLMRWFRMIAPTDGVILDFFAGSGSTAEAVMRLNAEDGGTRQAILVTNNELAATDAKKLQKDGYQPGDPEWEARGVFQHVTKPRLETVATGIRAAETADPGSRYSDGLAATVDFYDLDYLESDRVRLDLAFRQVAPLLWLKAGGRGDVITDRPEKGYAVTAHYGVLHDVDQWRQFALELPPTATHAFIVTDTPVAYQTAAAALPDSVEKLRLYENYLHTFEINTHEAADTAADRRAA